MSAEERKIVTIEIELENAQDLKILISSIIDSIGGIDVDNVTITSK